MLANKTDKVIGCSYEKSLEMSFDELKDSLKDKSLSADYWDILGRYFLLAGELCIGVKKDEEAIHNLEFAQGCFDEAASNYSTYSFNRQVDLEKIIHLKARIGIIDS